MERTTAWFTADDDWLSIARVTLRTGLAEGLDDRLVWVGLNFELGEGLGVRLGALPRADVTVGELKSRSAVSATLNPAADVDVFLAGCADLAGPVDPGAGHICFGQVTMGVRVALLLVLATSRIRATASATSTTVGKITAKKLNFRFG
jgi:hypothetical protein